MPVQAPIEMLARLREHYAQSIADVIVSGMIGPRGDGYRSGAPVDAEEAAAYHRPQLEAFAGARADMAIAYTLTDVGEAIGIVAAAREVCLPIAVSFTVETDGRLPGGDLAEAISDVDHAKRPEYFGGGAYKNSGGAGGWLSTRPSRCGHSSLTIED